jgi:hypothetical protein
VNLGKNPDYWSCRAVAVQADRARALALGDHPSVAAYDRYLVWISHKWHQAYQRQFDELQASA